MTERADLLLLALVAIDLYIVGTSRLIARIRASALQGVVLAALVFVLRGPSAMQSREGMAHLAATVLGTLLVKAVIIPVFLSKALRDSGVRREVEPFVSLHVSLLVAGALVGMSFWLGSLVPLPSPDGSPLALPAGLSTLLVGLYLTVNAKKDLTRVIGYLVAEHGVFVIGQVVVGELIVVDVGVLLDVLVAVMLMAILFVRVDQTDRPTEPTTTDPTKERKT